MMHPFLSHILSFLIGSIPMGFLLAKIQGIDVRQLGSGNTGATNVARFAGKRLGLYTLLADIVKAVLASVLFSQHVSGAAFEIACATHGLAAVIGHCYSPFLGGKGGKGVAAALGVFLVIAPVATAIATLFFLGTFYLSRIVSLSSIIAALTHPLTYWLLNKGQPEEIPLLVSILVALTIVIRHHKNIERIVRGEEPQFGTKR